MLLNQQTGDPALMVCTVRIFRQTILNKMPSNNDCTVYKKALEQFTLPPFRNAAESTVALLVIFCLTFQLPPRDRPQLLQV
jgi:hypothetical protein